MYSTTGFSRQNIVDLCAMIHSETAVIDAVAAYPRTLQLRDRGADIYAPQPVQAELRNLRRIQPTISRAITVMTPLLGRCSENMSTADDLDGRTQYIVDARCCPAGPGFASGAVLRQAQDDRHERASRLHIQRRSRGFPTRWTGAGMTRTA